MKKALLLTAIFHLFAIAANAQDYACGRMNCPSASSAECKLDEMRENPMYWPPTPHGLPESAVEAASALHGQCVCVKGSSYLLGRELDFKSVENMSPFKGDQLCSNPGVPGFNGNSTSNGDLGGMNGGFDRM